MSATVWLIIAIVGFSLSSIALVAAIFMFIKMNIPAIIGDLTGKTVAREIKAIRDANVLSGDKIHKSSRVNIDRGKLTEKVRDELVAYPDYMAKAHVSKRLDCTESGSSAKIDVSQKLGRKHGNTTESLSSNIGEVDIDVKANIGNAKVRVTDILEEKNQTEILLLPQNCQTEVLSETVDDSQDSKVGNDTTVLSKTTELVEEHVRNITFKVTKSKVIIHSDEVIE